jgi:hypothetical protein
VKTKSILRVAAVALFLFSAVSTRAQAKQELITVKSAEINNGVVVITARGEKAPIELQCNKDVMGCAVLSPGDYVMVRLSKNHGYYECANVRVYAKGQSPDTTGQELGDYCISE